MDESNKAKLFSGLCSTAFIYDCAKAMEFKHEDNGYHVNLIVANLRNINKLLEEAYGPLSILDEP